MLNLRSIVLYACVASKDKAYLDRTLRVLTWCNSLAHWKETVLFTAIEPEGRIPAAIEAVQIPHFPDLPYGPEFQVFQAKTLPALLAARREMYYLGVHEDGFPIQPELWTPDFFHFDWVGPAWGDGLVGGSGMCLRTLTMLHAMIELPWMPHTNDDAWVCRDNREQLVRHGLEFASVDVANRFCTETQVNEKESFGFHGRLLSPEKYKRGWEMIEAWEAGR